MSVDLIRGLYGYHHWANRRLWDHAMGLGEAGMQRDAGRQFSMPTLKGMFAHLYAADFVWLERWQGRSPSRLPGDADFPTLADLRARWDQLETEQRRFVEGLGPDDLVQTFTYQDTQGNARTLAFGPILQHVPNHATHHRSEIATMLTMLSGPPPDTGISTYQLVRTGQITA